MKLKSLLAIYSRLGYNIKVKWKSKNIFIFLCVHKGVQMAKPSKKERKKQRDPGYDDSCVRPGTGKELHPKNSEQKSYINAIKNHTVVVCTGKPGTGKTFVPSVLAAQELAKHNSPYKRVVLIRPNEPLGKSLGMLPGDLKEKLEPWLIPIKDGIVWSIGKYGYEGLFKDERIQFVAVEHVRGRTFNNCFVIVDEAQNITKDAMAAILTRIGEDCKMIICGDIAQKDLKGGSGLKMLMDIKEKYEYVPFKHIELTENVRSFESSAFYDIFYEEGIFNTDE